MRTALPSSLNQNQVVVCLLCLPICLVFLVSSRDTSLHCSTRRYYLSRQMRQHMISLSHPSRLVGICHRITESKQMRTLEPWFISCGFVSLDEQDKNQRDNQLGSVTLLPLEKGAKYNWGRPWFRLDKTFALPPSSLACHPPPPVKSQVQVLPPQEMPPHPLTYHPHPVHGDGGKAMKYLGLSAFRAKSLLQVLSCALKTGGGTNATLESIHPENLQPKKWAREFTLER